MNNRVYIVTGANGHLGHVIVQKLLQQAALVRGLLLHGEQMPFALGEGFAPYYGDVRERESLRPLFAGLEGRQVVVIHTAAIIDITSQVSAAAQAVNVGGTRNMVQLAIQAGVYRFVHVSSVHAIPEAPAHRTIREVGHFSPGSVKGGYAKTKAEASQIIMDSVRKGVLPAIILHPSGIIGPQDGGKNNIVAAIRSFLAGKLPACPKGGYDFVDVRDVADACIAAVEQGRIGEAYILSGKHYEMYQLFAMLREIAPRKGKPCPVVPMWMAKLAAPVMEKWAIHKKQPPLYTKYSLYTLTSNANFSHEKASRELGFWPRDLYHTLCDTVAWLSSGKEKSKKEKKSKRKALTAN